MLQICPAANAGRSSLFAANAGQQAGRKLSNAGLQDHRRSMPLGNSFALPDPPTARRTSMRVSKRHSKRHSTLPSGSPANKTDGSRKSGQARSSAVSLRGSLLSRSSIFSRRGSARPSAKKDSIVELPKSGIASAPPVRTYRGSKILGMLEAKTWAANMNSTHVAPPLLNGQDADFSRQSSPETGEFWHHLHCLASIHEAVLHELSMGHGTAKITDACDREAGAEPSSEPLKTPEVVPQSHNHSVKQNGSEPRSSAPDEPKVIRKSQQLSEQLQNHSQMHRNKRSTKQLYDCQLIAEGSEDTAVVGVFSPESSMALDNECNPHEQVPVQSQEQANGQTKLPPLREEKTPRGSIISNAPATRASEDSEEVHPTSSPMLVVATAERTESAHEVNRQDRDDLYHDMQLLPNSSPEAPFSPQVSQDAICGGFPVARMSTADARLTCSLDIPSAMGRTGSLDMPSSRQSTQSLLNLPTSRQSSFQIKLGGLPEGTSRSSCVSQGRYAMSARNSMESCGSVAQLRRAAPGNTRLSDLSAFTEATYTISSTTVPGQNDNFKCWPEWARDVKSTLDKGQGTLSLFTPTMSENKDFGIEQTLTDKNNKVVRSLMIRPGSFIRLAWDLLGCFILLFDLATLPFYATFEIEDTLFIEVAGWLLMIFWTFDMGLSFLTGYFVHGQLILQPSKIARHYLRTWFIPDFVIIALDWTMRLLTYATGKSKNESSRLVRTMRIIRFGRAVRLIRLLKITRLLNSLQERINSEGVSAIMDILTYIFILLGASHIVACIWYGVGRLGAEDTHDGRSWLIAHNMSERSVAYRYFSSLHWTLSFFAASCDIYAISTGERVMTVFVLIFALVGFSSFLSVITSAVMTMVNTRNELRRQFWMLRRYLKAKAISKSLALRVERYLEYLTDMESNAIQDGDVVLLTRLSEPLREELAFESFYAHLTPHPLFRVLNTDIKYFVHACYVLCIGVKDVSFCVGQLAERMLMVSSGRMSYERAAHVPKAVTDNMNRASTQSTFWGRNSTYSQRSSYNGIRPSMLEADMSVPNREFLTMMGEIEFYPEEQIYENDWVAEVVLWMPWTHVGNLIAEDTCQLVAIDSEVFRQKLSKQKAAWERTRRYAAAFVLMTNAMSPADWSDIMDREIIETEDVAMAIEAAVYSKHSSIRNKPTRRLSSRITESVLKVLNISAVRSSQETI